MNIIDRNTLAAILAIARFAVIGVGALHARDAGAQAKPPAEKVKTATKAALKQGLTVDLVTLEAQARAAHEVLQAIIEQIRAAEAALAAATPGTAEYDAASEAWLAAQGEGLEAQATANTAMRELEAARSLRASAAEAFVEERCAGDDGKNVSIKKVCDARAAAKAAAAASPVPPPPPVGP